MHRVVKFQPRSFGKNLLMNIFHLQKQMNNGDDIHCVVFLNHLQWVKMFTLPLKLKIELVAPPATLLVASS